MAMVVGNDRSLPMDSWLKLIDLVWSLRAAWHCSHIH